jgi:hypothetical protein
MVFGGINYLAVVVAALVAFGFGAVFYGVLSKPWMKAARIDPAAVKSGTPMPLLLANSLICELIMALVLAGVIGHLGVGEITVRNGLVSAGFVWAGFMATTMAVNHRYGGYGWDLTLIDGAHWLGVVLIMGAVIGAFGV